MSYIELDLDICSVVGYVMCHRSSSAQWSHVPNLNRSYHFPTRCLQSRQLVLCVGRYLIVGAPWPPKHVWAGPPYWSWPGDHCISRSQWSTWQFTWVGPGLCCLSSVAPGCAAQTLGHRTNQPACSNRGGCRQLPLQTSDYSACLSSSLSRGSHVNLHSDSRNYY